MKQKNSQKRSKQSEYSSGSSFGLEPPKKYRDNQKVSQYQQSGKSLTRQETRNKQNKKRHLKRGVRKALIAFCLIVLTVSVFTVLSLTVFFKIDTINVSGSKIYSNAEITNSFSINKGENLFLADTDKATEKLCSNLPYVYTATVKRKLPGTLNVVIKDAKVAYAVKTDKSYILMDDNFKVLKTASKDSAKAIVIKDVKLKNATLGQTAAFENDKIAKSLKQLSGVIKECSFSEATAISSKGLTENYIIYNNRITFKLGNCDNLQQKVYQGLAACKKLDENNPTAKGILTLTGEKQYYFTEK